MCGSDGMSSEQSGETVLTPDEWNKLDQLDSRQFGCLLLRNPENLRATILIQKAIRVFEKQLLSSKKPPGDFDEEDAKTYLKLGHLHLLADDFPKALSAYQLCLELDKSIWKDPNFFYGLGLVYFHFRAYEYAEEAFRRLLYVAPCYERSAEVHARLGIVYKAIGDFDQALKHLNCCLSDQTPCSLGSLELHYHIAHCLDLRGDLREAKLRYENIISKEPPPHVRACVCRQLGWIFYRGDFLSEAGDATQRLLKAVDWLGESLKYDQTSGSTYYYLGRCFSSIPGRAHEAFINYRHSIDKSEASADTWCSIGVLYQQQNQPMDALQAFVCAVQLDGHHSAAWTDLGLLYESQAQYNDALICLKNAAKYKPASPEALRSRIALLEKELTRSPLNKQKQSLPSLDEAWRLPIPAELTQRQDGFLKMKHEKYIQGSPTLRQEYEVGLDGKGAIPSFYLTQNQISTMRVMEQNQNQLEPTQRQMLRHLQQSFALMNAHSLIVQENNSHTQNPKSEDGTNGHPPALPELSQAEIMDVLATQPSQSSDPDTQAQTRASTEDDLMLGPDPMLSSAALKEQSRENTRDATDVKQEIEAQEPSPSPVREGAHSAVEDISATLSGHPPGRPPPPPSFCALSQLKVPTTISSAELLQMCRQRAANPCAYRQIFDEKPSPPTEPDPPRHGIDRDKLLVPIPSVVVDSKKDAMSLELQQFCYSAPMALIKGLTAALRLDLSHFSSKVLTQTSPEHQIEVRTQLKFDPDANEDQLGAPTWHCESTRGFTTVAKYAQYQGQSFYHSLKEEQERLKASAKQSEERRRREEINQRIRFIKFGTNLDLSDERKWNVQLQELNKLPSFCRPVAGCNILSHLGHVVYGMNTVQLYMKVPGSRTPGHRENNNFASVNINIGPGECEWFGVEYEYWGALNKMCKDRHLSCLKGSWWPSLEELWATDIPVYRFTQKAGDMVWVGPGALHWVQATGWCNNVAWNVGPMTAMQLKVALESYDWNRFENYKSLVPVQHLAWQLARNVRFTQVKLFEIIKPLLIRSLSHSQMCVDFVQGLGKQVRHHPRAKMEPAHYCANCEIEVWNILFVQEQNAKFVVYCCDCARRNDSGLQAFTILQQYTPDELAHAFDACVLYPQKQGVIC